MDLPEEVKQVESHLTWLNNILCRGKCAFKSSAVNLHWLQKRNNINANSERARKEGEKGVAVHVGGIDLEDAFEVQCNRQNPNYARHIALHLNSNDTSAKNVSCNELVQQQRGAVPVDGIDLDDAFQVQCNHQYPNYARFIALQLNSAAKCVYWGDFRGALKRLVRVQDILEMLTGNHTRLLEPTTYFVESLEWSIYRLQRKRMLATSFKLHSLQGKWEELQGDSKCQAVILYFKASFQRMFSGYNEETFADMFPIVNADPDYPVWYHYAYQAKRHARFLLNRTQGKMEAPSKEEVDLCDKGYQLAPDNLLSVFNYGLMMKDCLWSCEKGRYNFITFGECLEHFDTAILIAEENEMTEWIVKGELQKAELLMKVSGAYGKIMEGLQILEELIVKYPNCSSAHFELGKIYLSGVHAKDVSKLILRNFHKARYHLKLALDLPQRIIFFRLRIYMKLLRHVPVLSQLPLMVEEVLELLTRSLETSASLWPEQVVQIRMWRGCVLWKSCSADWNSDNRRAACEDWLYVLEVYPELGVKTLRALWNPSTVGLVWLSGIYTNELKQELEKIKGQGNLNESTLAALDLFLSKIQKVQVSTGWRGKERRISWNSLADKDDNWRA